MCAPCKNILSFQYSRIDSHSKQIRNFNHIEVYTLTCNMHRLENPIYDRLLFRTTSADVVCVVSRMDVQCIHHFLHTYKFPHLLQCFPDPRYICRTLTCSKLQSIAFMHLTGDPHRKFNVSMLCLISQGSLSMCVGVSLCISAMILNVPYSY